MYDFEYLIVCSDLAVVLSTEPGNKYFQSYTISQMALSLTTMARFLLIATASGGRTIRERMPACNQVPILPPIQVLLLPHLHRPRRGVYSTASLSPSARMALICSGVRRGFRGHARGIGVETACIQHGRS